MNKRKKETIILASIIAILAFALIFLLKSKKQGGQDTNAIIDTIIGVPIDTLRIDTIRVVTISSSTTYFLYKDQDMGYQYELLKLFSEKVKKPFSLEVLKTNSEILEYIESGKADLSITPFAQSKELKKKFDFVGMDNISAMVLVQAKNNKEKHISNLSELSNKKIIVPSNTRYSNRLNDLNAQYGADIIIEEVSQDSLLSEDIIRMLSEGKIDYTVSDEDLAKLSSTYYKNIDVSVSVGFEQNLRWIVSNKNKKLSSALNRWAKNLEENKSYKPIYKRYFEISKGYDNLDEPTTTHHHHKVELKDGQISPYDEIFKQEAKRIGWDWQVLAAIAYHESRFQSSVVGWSGARGLMGIMPATGRIYGANKEQLLDASTSIKVSVSCLLDTKKGLKISGDSQNEMAIILAGYNAGIGHIMDAKRLADKYGYNRDIWFDNLEQAIAMKRDPKYYNDQVVRFGYLRSTETVNYVRNVLSTYKSYLSATK